MASRRIEPEMIVAVAAVVVGVCALGVSLFQASIMREQQAEMRTQRLAEVWPHVEFGTSYNGESYRLLAMNSGIGPARIESVRILLDERPFTDWSELLGAIAGREAYNFQHSQLGGRVLPPGEMLESLVVTEPSLVDSLNARSDGITAEICYCSVYDECWQFRHDFSASPKYEPVKACATPEAAFEQ